MLNALVSLSNRLKSCRLNRLRFHFRDVKDCLRHHSSLFVFVAKSLFGFVSVPTPLVDLHWGQSQFGRYFVNEPIRPVRFLDVKFKKAVILSVRLDHVFALPRIFLDVFFALLVGDGGLGEDGRDRLVGGVIVVGLFCGLAPAVAIVRFRK